MKFKQYLQELTEIEPGQAEEAHEPTEKASSSIDNSRLRMEVNYRLVNGMNQIFHSPEEGIQAIRKVLHRYGFDLPALYDADPEGDEVIIEIAQYGGDTDGETNIYILYYLTDEGFYDFYAEIGDDERMEELVDETGEELEED
jgi:hypothetical protein